MVYDALQLDGRARLARPQRVRVRHGGRLILAQRRRGRRARRRRGGRGGPHAAAAPAAAPAIAVNLKWK